MVRILVGMLNYKALGFILHNTSYQTFGILISEGRINLERLSVYRAPAGAPTSIVEVP